jgi:hypothetical protein
MRGSPQSGFAPVGFPITFDTARPPRIIVSPTEGLTDGQTIEIRGVDVGEGVVEVQQCLLLSWSACRHRAVRGEPDGTFRLSLTLERHFTWAGHSSGSGSCSVEADCVIVVWVKGSDSRDVAWDNADAPIVLHFAPLPPSASSTTTSSPPANSETTPAPQPMP